VCTGGNLACTQVRTVNVQLAPGFVVQQPQEVASLERCEEQATVIEAEIAPGAIPRSHTYDRSYVQQDMFYWDDNNRFKPRTTVTTLVTRGNPVCARLQSPMCPRVPRVPRVPGMREGDELVFPRMSEQRPGAIPGDVRMRLKQEGGSSTGGGGGGGGGGDFKRRGDDLHVDLRISLKVALHPAPCTLHPAPRTPHPAPCPLRPLRPLRSLRPLRPLLSAASCTGCRLQCHGLQAALLGFDTKLVHLDGHFVKLERSDVTAPMQAHRARARTHTMTVHTVEYVVHAWGTVGRYGH
jgi:hypothetical protein